MSLIKFKNDIIQTEITLPASKSIYNRLLILKNLYNLNLTITNPSDSDDSLLLEKLIISEKKNINCRNAGTVMRFLTAYYAAQGKSKLLTGSKRMQLRPIGELVRTLNKLGAKINFKIQEGFPPIITGNNHLASKDVSINANESSQYLSALIMIGAYLQNGLTINIEGKTMSRPYVDMTLKLMKKTGFKVNNNENKIEIFRFNNKKNDEIIIHTEADWSAAAFWFEIVLLSKNLKIYLKNLEHESVQGDAVIAVWAKEFGIIVEKANNGLLLHKSEKIIENNTIWDFKNYPDLAPALIVMLAASKVKATITGIETLKLKESDRSNALKIELKKCNVDFSENGEFWILDASKFNVKKGAFFKHYNDHRIAMALAPLAILNNIRLSTGNVCNKSYPYFWQDLKKAGFEIIN